MAENQQYLTCAYRQSWIVRIPRWKLKRSSNSLLFILSEDRWSQVKADNETQCPCSVIMQSIISVGKYFFSNVTF